ncbi:uncharacterized protein LOC123703768 [Colias croceus]|uniref:uncharacterized protein LOC123703768 n=1 Tax=Colias crocea TaxID=72248 RepID=UPI001E2812DA|nr:uncharacterized protein LOC123703768 [Colias croceus]
MDSSGQVILVGENLGERHRCLNKLVTETCGKQTYDFPSLPENTPIERIFKIDVANRQKIVNYVLEALKDDDMLYVTRALKSTWLLDTEHRNIINPDYLETVLFPEMIKPAVNKMKHWIQANLKDSERCQIFYEYYKSNFDKSINFLWCCSREFIKGELINIIHKITPKHLARLCDACPQIATIYYEGLKSNRKALTRYLDSELEYFNSLKCLLKMDGNMYLDLVELYFNEYRHSCFSPSLTRYIMKNFKNRFMAKPELYTTQFLNTKTLAVCLSAEECKELVLLLAKAEYIESWFSYKSVEPLIKRLPPDERASFKKLVFGNKTVGDKVKEWPYPTPSPLKLVELDDHIFSNEEHDDYEIDDCEDMNFRRCLKKRKYMQCSMKMEGISCQRQTLLDQLFNRYRITGFAKTFTELSGRLQISNTVEERQSILLVLVSKSGRVPEQVEKLMRMLEERHINEPSNLRAAIVRSFVKRGCIWRASDAVWASMLKFGHGLGLDGGAGDPLCVEGVHAVTLRHLINNSLQTIGLMDAFKKHFTTFKDYELSAAEIKLVKENLPPLLLPECPNEFLDLVSAYKMNVNEISGAVDTLAKISQNNPDLIERLFDKKIARRQLIPQTFPIKQSEASYMNALRHDVSLLDEGESFAALASKRLTNHDRFLKSLRIYFSETNGLAAKHLTALEDAFHRKPKSRLVRSLAILSSNYILLKRIQEIETKSRIIKSKIAPAFKVLVHKTKPPVDIDAVGWRVFGAKAVANRVFICRSIALEQYVKSCLEWPQTYGIGLRLALNTSFEEEAFTYVSEKKPIIALSVAVAYYFANSRIIKPSIWKIVKNILLNMDISKCPKRTYKSLTNNVPKNIEAEFWTISYQINITSMRNKATSALSKLEKILPKVDPGFIGEVVENFIKNDLSVANLLDYDKLRLCGIRPTTSSRVSSNVMSMYMRITAKYLLLCKNEKEQLEKIENVLNPFFDRIDESWKEIPDKSCIVEFMNEFLRSLKYTEVFIDTEYTSCLLMFEKIIARLHKVMARLEYFEKFVKLHFIILFFKAIRSAIAQDPNIFKHENKDNAMKVVGTYFGQYMGSEIKELVAEFFISIIEIYKEGLTEFLKSYIGYTPSKHKFTTPLIKGLVKNNNLEAHLLAQHVFAKEYHKGSEHYDDVFNTLKSSEFQEVQFILLQTDYITRIWY